MTKLQAARALVKLLEDAHPGFLTWQAAYRRLLDILEGDNA